MSGERANSGKTNDQGASGAEVEPRGASSGLGGAGGRIERHPDVLACIERPDHRDGVELWEYNVGGYRRRGASAR